LTEYGLGSALTKKYINLAASCLTNNKIQSISVKSGRVFILLPPDSVGERISFSGFSIVLFVAAWRSGNSVGRINEVTLRRARLVLGWVTSTGSTPGGGTLFRYVTSHAGRLSLSSFRAQ